MDVLPRLLRPLTRSVTYTRWLHLCVPVALIAVWLFIDMEKPYVPMLLLLPVGLVPAMRLGEGVQAQMLLLPLAEREAAQAAFAAARSATWRDRWRTVLWLEVRLLLSAVTLVVSVWLPLLSYDLVVMAAGGSVTDNPVLDGIEPQGWYALIAPLPLALMLVCVVGLGNLVTAVARRLLGPSAKERLLALEERTEQLLERNRIARELHDSIGHALTVAVVQAGAARAARDPEFTDRALAAIEDTGRAALEDLERVLRVLREERTPVAERPTLADADRLIDSARASGAEVDVEMDGPLMAVAGPVSRESYRILQESLTNALRHSGPVPIRVRMAVADGRLELEVSHPLGAASAVPGSGSGLRGIRERSALLGGKAKTGPYDGRWMVHVSLPTDGIG